MSAENAEVVTVVGYIRVSTDDQAESGLGMEAQRMAIVEECERRGWRLLEVFEDAGQSGKSLDRREALQAALGLLRAKGATALVVAKLDRLSRSVMDFATVMETSRKQGWSLVILDLGVDTTTPAGEMVANVMATFAQFERRLIGQRTRAALAVKKAQGVRLGRPRTLPDEVVDLVVTEAATGASYSAIARLLNEAGVPTAHGGQRWHPNTVRQILLSRAVA